MKVLDLFCCQGGASAGYASAGFEVVGVDMSPQPRYPYEFHQGDALEFLKGHGREFDLIHASPPCQAYSAITPDKSRHPAMIGATREALMDVGRPWVIENVGGARLHMNSPTTLCGSMFGLGVWRHRLFESSFLFTAPGPCAHRGQPWGVYGNSERQIALRPSGTSRGRKAQSVKHASEVLGGVEWMNWHGMTQCIPPAYTRHIGAAFLNAFRATF